MIEIKKISIHFYATLFFCILITYGYAQKTTRQFSFVNFDKSKVEIRLELNNDFINQSNQNWYDVAKMGQSSEQNYFNLITAVFNYNKDSLKFLYDMFEGTLPNVSSEYFINTVIGFVQTIPYQIPPLNYHGKATSGLFAPAICLFEGYGDCDTKSLLLCCIIAHKFELIFIMGTNHAFVGIKCNPGKNQEYVEINNTKYVLCEMTSRWDLGELPVSSVYDINKGKYKYLILKY